MDAIDKNSQIDDVMFEWDLTTDALTVTDNWEKKFGARNFRKGESLSNMLLDEELLPFASEDMVMLRDRIRQLQGGKSYVETILRATGREGKDTWYRIRAMKQFDKKGKPVKVIGFLMDIDGEINRRLSSQKKSDQDTLTNLYNKIATQSLIREYLRRPDVTGTLMLIDIDNFKQVNDARGHLFGDAVLCELSRVLMKSFRDSDVLGRTGGDEFLIFLKGVGTRYEAEQNAKRILQIFNQILKEEETPEEMSCSIGLSLYPQDGEDFLKLYQNAGYSLHHAKKKGKNRYEFFDESIMKDCVEQEYQPDTLFNAQLDSNMESRILNAEFVEYVFQILYTSHQALSSITGILGIVGSYFNISRVYILEKEKNQDVVKNTFEWCNKGIESEEEIRDGISYEKFAKFHENKLDERQIFYAPDRKTIQKTEKEMVISKNAKVVLRCGMIEQGQIKGIIGFDSHKKNHDWTPDQIDVLVLISNLISTFLLKERMVEYYRDENVRLRLLVEGMGIE